MAQGKWIKSQTVFLRSGYLRAHAAALGSRILETCPPLQSTEDPLALAIGSISRKALPAQALAMTGTAKYLRQAKAARIVADRGAGKTLVALAVLQGNRTRASRVARE